MSEEITALEKICLRFETLLNEISDSYQKVLKNQVKLADAQVSISNTLTTHQTILAALLTLMQSNTTPSKKTYMS